MGKSGKKVKSDRINALRKQYDAFLEDDKKRKDRNEYILGRLEEMRSSAALENSRLNSNYYPVQRIPNYLNVSSKIQDNLRTFQNKTNIPVDCLTTKFESSILKEISKNYILIPKLQSCPSDLKYHTSENILHTSENDSDWKSKYEILNKLKKSEKETTPDEVNDVISEPNKQSIPTDVSENKEENKITDSISLTDNLQDYNFNIQRHELKTNKSNSNSIQNNHSESSTDYKPLVKSDDVIQFEEKQVEIAKISKSNEDAILDDNKYIEISPHVNELKFEENSNIKDYNDIQNYDTPQEININMTENKNETENELKENIDYDHYDNESFIKQNVEGEVIEQDINNEVVHIKKIDCQEVTNKNNIVKLENPQEIPQNYREDEPESNNIQQYELNEGPVDGDQSANIQTNELEKEQNEMFYAENSEKQYENDQSNIETHEYSPNNENYVYDQYYGDEAQQEQPYTTEINEHEESTERYDPNYEQQYANNYENDTNMPQYDNQQYEVDNSYEIQQEPVNFEEVQPNNENFDQEQVGHVDTSYPNQDNAYYENENYETQQYDTSEQQEYSTTVPIEQDQYEGQQEYIQMQTEQETVKHMERELDAEDGYIDNQNTILKDNIEEPIVSDVLPVTTES